MGGLATGPPNPPTLGGFLGSEGAGQGGKKWA
jgi:hypothetical protein